MATHSGVPGARAVRRRPVAPLTLVLAIFLGQLVAFCALALFTPSHVLQLDVFQVGDDYQYFLNAAERWLAGSSPYLQHGFVTPPASMLPQIAMRHLPPETARDVFTAATSLLLAASLWRFAAALGIARRRRIPLLMVAFAFMPTWMLLNGSNYDGVMVALMMFAYSARSRIVRALLLASSVVLKVYSGMMLVVMTRRRQWVLLLLTVALSALALLPFWRLLPELLAVLLYRGGTYSVGAYNNLSPAALFMLALARFGPLAWKLPYALFWLGTLVYVLARDRSEGAESLAVYVPWMIAAPPFVWAYAGVVVLPAFALLVRVSEQRALRWYEWMGVAGFVLLDIHPEFVALILNLGWEARKAGDLVTSVCGSLGTTLLMLAMVARVRQSGSAALPAGEIRSS